MSLSSLSIEKCKFPIVPALLTELTGLTVKSPGTIKLEVIKCLI